MRLNAGTFISCHGIRRIASVLMTFSICVAAAAGNAAETVLPAAKDLPAEAREAVQQGMPLIVMVSLPGCPYCEVVRRSHLLPLLNLATDTHRPVIRQVEFNGSEKLRDFNGTEITHQAFARQHKVKIAPVVFFFDAHGEQIAAPLVGAMIPDFYGAYFDAAVKEARQKIVDDAPLLKPKASP